MKRLHRLPKDMLLVISDSRRALLLRNTGTEIHPSLEVLDRIVPKDTAKEMAHFDRSGRRFDGGDKTALFRSRSAMEQNDPRKLQSMAFADQLTNDLIRMLRQRMFLSIVLASPPAFLGALRDAMPPEARRHVVAEIPKHLTEATIDDIQRALVAPW